VGRPGAVPTAHPCIYNARESGFDPETCAMRRIAAESRTVVAYPGQMPVIVVGADTPLGAAVIPELQPMTGELRLFVSDPDVAEELRPIAKVAVGDVSDGSHVGGAAIGAFCAVLIAACASDARERSFATSPAGVFAQWADWLRDLGLARIIFVGNLEEIASAALLETAAAEYATVATDDTALGRIAAEVARLESSRHV